MQLLAREYRPLLLYSGLPQIPPTCHCNYFSISSVLDQDLLLTKKNNLTDSVTCTSEKAHPALLWVHGQHSERAFNTEKAKTILLGLLFKESAAKPVNAV